MSAFARPFRLFVVLLDLLCVILAYFISIYLRNSLLKDSYMPIGYFEFQLIAFSILAVWWLLLFSFDLGVAKRFVYLKDEMRIGILTMLFGSGIIFGLCFLSKYYFPRSLLVSFSICFFILWAIQKCIGYYVVSKIREKRKIPILIVGAGNRAMEFIKDAINSKKGQYNIVGLLDAREDSVGRKVMSKQNIIGCFGDLASILENYLVDEVFFVLDPKHFGYLDSLLKICSVIGKNSHLVYTSGRSTYKAFPDSIGEFPVITYSCLPRKENALFLKRVFDIVLSAILLILLSPLFLIVAILMKIIYKGPVFFPWRVVGTNNRDFVGYKFRTMVENAEELKESLFSKNEMNGPVFKMKNDPRITFLGKWLRKYSIDELPQLWSVLKGDMSLVGPRPPNRKELLRYEFWQRRKISFKPGITCLWQVRGRNQICDFSDWCKLDLEYIDNWSLWLDFTILVRTAWVVIRGSGC